MSVLVKVNIRSSKIKGINTSLKAVIRQCIATALKLEDFVLPCALDVTLTNDETIRSINREFRDIDAATDVLSFPMQDMKNGAALGNIEAEADPDSGRIMLGDIVISMERAQRQAEEFGHSIERECGFLAVHSALHLLGYDHDAGEEDRMRMREKEEAVLSLLNLTR